MVSSKKNAAKIFDIAANLGMKYMEANKNRFILSQDHWLDKFKKDSVKWVDMELIDLILNSLNISRNQFARFTEDSLKWTTKINKGIKEANKSFRVNYEYIRNAADFLAIPPWLLFYRKHKGDDTTQINEELISKFQSTPPHLPRYKINNLFRDGKVEFYENGKLINDKAHKDLSDNFGSEFYGHESIIEGTWKEISDFLENNHRVNNTIEFSGAALLDTEEETRYVRLGTVRFKNKKHKGNTKKELKDYGMESFWSTAWLAISLEEEQFKRYEGLINTIREDISHFLTKCYPWEYEVISSGKIIRLYSWHSLRQSNDKESMIKLEYGIEQKLIDVKSHPEITIQDMQFMQFRNLYLRKSINSDKVQVTEMTKYLVNTIKDEILKERSVRREDTITLLFLKGDIKPGAKLEMKFKIRKGENLYGKITSATVVLDDDIPKLKWDYDEQIYYITPLTQKIIDNFDINALVKPTNGNIFWGRKGENMSLLELLKRKPESNNVL
jgi:hypothetical protein